MIQTERKKTNMYSMSNSTNMLANTIGCYCAHSVNKLGAMEEAITKLTETNRKQIAPICNTKFNWKLCYVMHIFMIFLQLFVVVFISFKLNWVADRNNRRHNKMNLDLFETIHSGNTKLEQFIGIVLFSFHFS